MTKVSIIIPVYNKQFYLNRTLDSVLDQEFSDFELIVVDDGSTDDSLAILNEYAEKDRRISVIHTENYGVSHARNVGLERAKGEWIQFLDGDDRIKTDYLQKCQAIIADPEIDIIFSEFDKTSINGDVVSTIRVPAVGKDGSTLDRFIQYQYQNGFYGFISNKLFRKSLLKKTQAKFNESLKLAEDLDFFVQLYKGSSMAYYLPAKSFDYLQTQENYLYNTNIDYLGQLDIQKKIRQWVIDKKRFDQYKSVVDQRVCSYAVYAVFDAALRGEDIHPICNRLLQDNIVLKCLDPSYVRHKAHKRIVASLQKNDINGLARYLKTRETIKRLFGR